MFFIKGEERVSEVTGKPEPYYSPWKRNFFRWKISSKLCLIEGRTVQILCHSPGYSSFSPDCLHLCLPHFGVPGLGENKIKKVRLFQQLFQQWIDKLIVEKNYFQFLRYIPKILLAIIIPIFDGFYHKVAVWLNDMGESIMYQIIFCHFF